MEPSLEAFLATWIRHFRHFYLEGKTYELPPGRGLPSGFGALRVGQVGLAPVGSSSLIARVRLGTGSQFIGTGWVWYGFYSTLFSAAYV
jgi:hypothetical protein